MSQYIFYWYHHENLNSRFVSYRLCYIVLRGVFKCNSHSHLLRFPTQGWWIFCNSSAKLEGKNIRNNYLFDPARRVLKISVVEGYSTDQGILWLHGYRKFITVYTLDHILSKLNAVHTFTSSVRPQLHPDLVNRLLPWGVEALILYAFNFSTCAKSLNHLLNGQQFTAFNILLLCYVSVKIALEWFYLSVNCQSKLPGVSHIPLLPLMLLLNALK
jgi:hypothetical protein